MPERAQARGAQAKPVLNTPPVHVLCQRCMDIVFLESSDTVHFVCKGCNKRTKMRAWLRNPAVPEHLRLAWTRGGKAATQKMRYDWNAAALADQAKATPSLDVVLLADISGASPRKLQFDLQHVPTSTRRDCMYTAAWKLPPFDSNELFFSVLISEWDLRFLARTGAEPSASSAHIVSRPWPIAEMYKGPLYNIAEDIDKREPFLPPKECLPRIQACIDGRWALSAKAVNNALSVLQNFCGLDEVRPLIDALTRSQKLGQCREDLDELTLRKGVFLTNEGLNNHTSYLECLNPTIHRFWGLFRKVYWAAYKSFLKFQNLISTFRELELSNFTGLILGCIKAKFWKSNFTSKYSLERSRRDLHNAFLCAVL